MLANLLQNMEAYISFHEKNKDKVLRGSQFQMIRCLYQFLIEGNNEGYFVAPTGYGKTVLMTQIVKLLPEEVFIVVPTRPLLHQTQDELSVFCEGIDSGLVYGLKKEFGRKISILTYSTFQKLVDGNKIDPTAIKYLLLDEPHMSLSEKRINAVEKCTNALKIGFTASPFYSEEKNVDLLLKKLIYSVSIKQAVEEGFLAPFRVIVAETNVDLTSVRMSNGEYEQKLLAKTIDIEARNLAAVKLHKKTKEFRKESTLVHCVNIAHAKNVAELFRNNGYKAVAVHSQMDQESILKILNDFKKGVVQILCNVDMVGVGFNAPIASICFNLRPTRSVVIATQRARNLRIDKNNPQKFAFVVDFFDQDKRGQYAISYADVAEATYIIPKRSTRVRNDLQRYIIKEVPQIEGLKIHTNSRKIYEITNSDFQLPKLPYEEWVEEIRGMNIDGTRKYQQELFNHPTWPKDPYGYYPTFPGFTYVCEKRHPIIPFDQFVEEVSTLGVFTRREYSLIWCNHPGWPSDPENTYGIELFMDWSKCSEKKFLKKCKLLEKFESEIHRQNPYEKNFAYEPYVKWKQGRERRVQHIWEKIHALYVEPVL